MVEQGVLRRLAAIFVADAVDYSRLMGEHEVATHQRFKTDLEQLLHPRINEHRGRVVKTTGDGLLAEFGSVVDAVQCAEEVQRELAQRNAGTPEHCHLAYRIGINLGDIIVERDDIYGDEVNVAVRIEGLAEPGGISVSGNVYRQVHRKLPLDFEDMGEHAVKNIAEPVRVYRLRVGPQAQASRGPPAAATPQPASEKPAIVVLPFDNLSHDPEQEYFCDGLTNDITTDLCKFSDLFVIAANSAFVYRRKPVRVQTLARDLGIQYVLEGSAQRAGDRVRINAQLIDAATEHHLWAERFDRQIDDLFGVQDEIIQIIVSALAVKLTAAESRRAMRKRPENMSAYDAFLRGIHVYSTESEATLAESQRWFEQAARSDPGYARAWAAQSYNHVQRWLHGWAGREALELARDLALRAVRLDPDDHFTRSYLAFYFLSSGQFDLAIQEYEEAMALNRNDADLMMDMSEALVCVGEHERALQLIARAMPRNPHVPDWYRWDLGWALYFAGQYDGAVEALQRIVQPHPHVGLLIAACEARRSDTAAAAARMTQFLQRCPDWTVLKERQSIGFKHRSDEDHWVEGVRLAGLPEGRN